MGRLRRERELLLLLLPLLLRQRLQQLLRPVAASCQRAR